MKLRSCEDHTIPPGLKDIALTIGNKCHEWRKVNKKQDVEGEWST